MKRLALCLAGVVAVSVSMLAQRGGPPAPPPPLEPGASQADVDLALLAAPARLKDQAMVVKWKPDHTYTVLRKNGANNNLVCYDRSGFPLQQAFSIECTNIGNLERVKQNMTIEALGDRAKAQAAFDEAEKGGTRVKPEFGSVFYHIQGPDKDRANPHMTIAVPGATQASLGLPESGRGGGVWIMNAGSTTAHLMVPGE